MNKVFTQLQALFLLLLIVPSVALANGPRCLGDVVPAWNEVNEDDCGHIFLNLGPCPPGGWKNCREDLNMDGIKDMNDVILCQLQEFGPCDPCDADIDNSGTVGLGDLLIVLARWGNPTGDVADIVNPGGVGAEDLHAVLLARDADSCS